jgi:hypothetical protein
LVTLELNSLDSTLNSRLLRVYDYGDSGFTPVSGFITGLDWPESDSILLLGSARLDDYDGELPVFAGIHRDTRPSVYGVLYVTAESTFAFTTNPFPLEEWFSKERVLPAGQLDLYNIGDTLIAYGYFVPGSRPSGPSRSFAALQDGEWRLLPLTAGAERIGTQVCRFSLRGESGWLELDGDMFRFYPGEAFAWREPVKSEQD